MFKNNRKNNPPTVALRACSMACVAVTLLSASLVGASEPIVGQYAEARTCDVWTGPCFANGEINLVGKHAVMAWSVQRGTHNGVSLAGRKIVAILDADGTLHTESEGKVRALLYVDADATVEQAHALQAMATALAPDHLKNIIRVERETITFSRDGLAVRLRVGESSKTQPPKVALETTALSAHCDTICGNEEKAYPTLSKNSVVTCAKTVEHAYTGKDLGGSRWSQPQRRSAMVGSFAL